MSQIYHANAKTNQHIRAVIQSSTLKNIELAEKFGVNVKTIAKYKKRTFTVDKSSKPNQIHYRLTELEKEIITIVRKTTWMELDDIVDTVALQIPSANRSNVYRTLLSKGINRVPEEKKRETKKFKEYEPGYLHIDVTYLPKLQGVKYYLFVAIDRATRLLHYKIYENKTAVNAVNFLEEVKDIFPFYITHILTDNGLEFTDKFVSKNKKPTGNHQFDLRCNKDNIDHRLTAPFTPQTNGMVERVNGTIKNKTIKLVQYKDLAELRVDINKFLIYYNLNRTHGSLRKELKVRTPLEAIHSWYKTKPEIFKFRPDQFKAKFLKLMEQRGET
jgi:transposase InsO family protein